MLAIGDASSFAPQPTGCNPSAIRPVVASRGALDRLIHGYRAPIRGLTVADACCRERGTRAVHEIGDPPAEYRTTRQNHAGYARDTSA